MGHTTAVGLAHSGLDLEVSLGYHLQGNHYPPVPLSMVQPCMDAIDAYFEEDYNRLIELPEGVTYRGGATSAPAYAIVENHHLDAYLQYDGEDDFDEFGE